MVKFRVQFSEDVKKRTIESPKGDYLVCLEGYFDFNEALMKLMISQGNMLPTSAQFEPGAESDTEDDMNFSDPQFDDVCDAILEAERVNRSLSDSLAKAKAKAFARQPVESDPKDDVKDDVVDDHKE